MADGPRYRTLIETPEYTAQMGSIAARYSMEVIEPVLMGLLWGIAANPEEYDKVTWNIYAAKSRSLGLTVPEGTPFEKFDRLFHAVISVPRATIDKEEETYKRRRKTRAKKHG